jgi:hypothetical protein
MAGLSFNVQSGVNLQSNTIQNYTEFATGSSFTGTSATVPSNTNVVRYILNNNTTITLPSSQPGVSNALKTIVLMFTQDATGGRTMTLAAPSGESIKYNNASTQPAVVSGAGKTTIYTCMKFDSDTVWRVALSYIDA